MSGLVRLWRQKHNPPAPTTQPFTGKTILVTGTTSGLGLEAAKKLAVLDPTKLIITARTAEKGEKVKKLIQEHVRTEAEINKTKTVPNTDIVVLTLDMSSLAGVSIFISALKSHLGQRPYLDAAILNAGTSQRAFSKSPDGYEQTLQINTISTVFLAKQLLPLLLAASSEDGLQPSHLTFVSSGLANLVKPEFMSQFMNSTHVLRDLSLETNFPPGRFGGQVQYGRSKLLIEYAMRHMAADPSITATTKPSNNGQQPPKKVIINSTCPGMCSSDLGRQYADSLFFRVLVWILYTIFARSASQGANIYISALTRDETSHAVMWKEDRNYDAGPMLTSKEGKAFGDQAWKELDEITG